MHFPNPASLFDHTILTLFWQNSKVVVVLTLAVNGTTTGALLRALGLTRPDVSVQVAVDKARRHIRRQCMAVYHEHLTTHDDVMGTADFRVVQVRG